MKKRFLQPRVAPVSLDAEKPAAYEDRRYAEQRARGVSWLRLHGDLENEYLRQSSSLWVRRGFALALLAMSIFVISTRQDTLQWTALALTTTLGWIALYLSARHSRNEFLVRGELQQLAQVDGLTGAMNRRAFHQHMDLIWRQAQRENKLVGLMVLDIDHFKLLNDQHGHHAGDTVLRATAQILKSYALRALDVVSRYGGDEFVVVWYGADPVSFAQLAQLLPAKLWMGLAATDLRRAEITVSGGAVLARPSAAVTIDGVIRAADEQLYRIKRAFRGSIALAPGVLESDLADSPAEARKNHH